MTDAIARRLRFARSGSGAVGLAILLAVVLIALVGPWFAPHGPDESIGIPLEGRSADAPLAEIAARLDSTEGAVKVAVLRLRKRFREALRAEIAETVATEGQIDEEIADLFRALESRPEV